MCFRIEQSGSGITILGGNGSGKKLKSGGNGTSILGPSIDMGPHGVSNSIGNPGKLIFAIIYQAR